MLRQPQVTLTPADIARRVTESDAYFTRSDIVRSVATGATQGATLDQIDAKVDEFLASVHAVELVKGRIWTTPEILTLERRTVDAATAGPASGTGVAAAAAVESATTARPSLSDEQQAMVRRLALSGNAVDVVVGRPGSGKTFALDAVRSAYEASGYRVLGSAMAAWAARELEAGSGIPSRTAASLQAAVAGGNLRLDARTVLVIDEAATVGTRQLAALVAEARRAGTKLIAVGDPKQLPEIQAGGLFAALDSRLGHLALTGNRRQADPAERTALVDLRAGRVDAALGRLVSNGNVTVTDNAELARDAMVADWLNAEANGADVVMVALRRDDIDDLNDRARLALRNAGRLGPDALMVDDVGFALGDRVLAHRNRYDLGLLNGDTGVVAGVDDRRLVVDLDGGRRVKVPTDYLEAGHLGHGYARTIHKAQGMTCDQALLLGSESLFAEAGYTGLSRGREHNHLYAVASSDDFEPIGDDPLARVRHSLAVSTRQDRGHGPGRRGGAMNRPQPPTRQADNTFDMVVLGVGAVAIAAGAVLWLGAQAASLVHSHHSLDLDARGVALALRQIPSAWGDPRAAFEEPARSQLPGPVLFWVCVVLAFAACMIVVSLLWRVLRSDRTPLDRRSRLGVSTEARLATAKELVILIVRRPQPGRFLLGRFHRHLIAAENPPRRRRRGRRRGRRQGDIGSVALIGPSRSGKTRCAESGIRAWEYPPILSSVKTDLLAATIEERRRVGNVRVFDPTGVTGIESSHWTPLRAASTLQGAAATAKGLVDAAPRDERHGDSHWLKQAEILPTSLLWLAANSEKRTISDVVAWVMALDRPTENSGGTVAPLLRAHVDNDSQTGR